MTSAILVNRLNTLLDQVATVSTFWTLAHYYEALSAGQRLVATILNKINPESPVLKTILKDLEINNNYTGDVPADFLDINAAVYAYDGSSFKRARFISYDQHLYNLDNSYLSPSKNAPVIYTKGSKFYFYPIPNPVTKAKGIITYISNPADISGSDNPVLSDSALEAIAHYAWYLLLARDENPNAASALKIFNDLVSAL